MNFLEVALMARMHGHNGYVEEARARLDQGPIPAEIVTIMRENGARFLHQIGFGFQKTVKFGGERGIAGNRFRAVLHRLIRIKA